MRSQNSPLLVIVGPTGSGKSALALRLAASFPAEVVSCDALQVYRGADIGTGKLSVSERHGIPHHLLDVVDPSQGFSAASYIRLAAPIIDDIRGRGRVPVVVGGTGLYLRALRRGLFEGPGRDSRIRDRMVNIAGRRGREFVHRMLHRVDPASAGRIHPNDLVRTVRALEVCLLAGRPMSDLMRERASPLAGYHATLVGVAPPRRELAARIERRVRGMFALGLVDEVRGILKKFGRDAPVIKAIGYRQVAQYLAGEVGLDEAQGMTVRATLQYAKRQMTWFRREEGVVWFTCCGDDPEAGERIEAYLRARRDFAPRGDDEGTAGRHELIESGEFIEAIEPMGPFNEEGVHAETAS
jgi:tRNA dimethylallyltransferase